MAVILIVMVYSWKIWQLYCLWWDVPGKYGSYTDWGVDVPGKYGSNTDLWWGVPGKYGSYTDCDGVRPGKYGSYIVCGGMFLENMTVILIVVGCSWKIWQ